jgi:heterotetrameric sarcosine oxidase gamma subunit
MTAPRYAVEIVRLPLEARFELAGHRAEIDVALQAAGLPVPAAAKATSRSKDARVAWVGPRRWLICAPQTAAKGIGMAVSEAFTQSSSSMIVDVTGSVETFLLRGADVAAVLEQGIAHDLSTACFPAATILATEGWGVGLLLERDGEHVRVTVDIALAAYMTNCLHTAAGQETDARPGVMRAPPPPLVVSR